MSKVSFRARALDSNRFMPVFNAVDIPDLAEYAAINRAVPAMPTGIEKDEEMELHLQQAISAQQTNYCGLLNVEDAVIPTPRVISDVSSEHYKELYDNSFKAPKSLIRVEASLSFEPEVPEYDVDSEDEAWLAVQNQAQGNTPITNLQFETIMERLETASERQVVTLQEAKLLLNEDDDVLQNVYDYWVDKRLKKTYSLMPRVRTDKRLMAASTSQADQQSMASNPYLAFRRRAEKMQTRKNRKNDEDGYEKILKLRHDLRKAVTLLDMVKHREVSKRELIRMDHDVVDLRINAEDFDGRLYDEILRQSKPTFSFKESAKQRAGATGRKRKRSGRLPSDSNSLLVSRNYLQQAADEFNRPVGAFDMMAAGTSAQSTTSSTPSDFPLHATDSASTSAAAAADKLSVDRLLSRDATDSCATHDGLYAFKRRKGCVYLAPTEQPEFPYNNIDGLPSSSSHYPDLIRDRWTQQHHHQQQQPSHLAFYRTYLRSRADGPGQGRLRCIGMARRRVGRGGRVLFDRLPQPESAPVEYLSPSGSSKGVSPCRSGTTTMTDNNLVGGNSNYPHLSHSHNAGLFSSTSTATTTTTQHHTTHTTPNVSMSLHYQTPATSLVKSARMQQQHVGNQSSQSYVYYRPRSPQRASEADTSERPDHSYSRLGWPKQTVPSLSGALGLNQFEFAANALDSGYSSPADARSRSLASRDQSVKRKHDGTVINGITRPKPLLAAIQTTSGRLLPCALQVGVSSHLYASHQRRLADAWRHAPICSDVRTDCCRRLRAAVPDSDQDSGANKAEQSIDRYKAFESVGAVQTREFVQQLWTQHQQRQQRTSGGGGTVNNNNNNNKTNSERVNMVTTRRRNSNTMVNGNVQQSGGRQNRVKQPPPTIHTQHNDEGGGGGGRGTSSPDNDRPPTNPNAFDHTHALPTPSPSPNSPTTTTQNNGADGFKPIAVSPPGTNNNNEYLIATGLVDRHRVKKVVSPLTSTAPYDDINTSPVSQHSSLTSNGDVDVVGSPTHPTAATAIVHTR